MLTKTLSVAAIKSGSVIDHITAGQALAILQMLKLTKGKGQVTVGLNLPSEKLGAKDLIKIEDLELSPEQGNKIAILAPHATITIIQDYEVNNKFRVTLPDRIYGIITCPNPTCITHSEGMKGSFVVSPRARRVDLRCHYCSIQFRFDDIQLGENS